MFAQLFTSVQNLVVLGHWGSGNDSQFRLSAIFTRYLQWLSKRLFLTRLLGTVYKGQNDIKIKSGSEVNIQISPPPALHAPCKPERNDHFGFYSRCVFMNMHFLFERHLMKISFSY